VGVFQRSRERPDLAVSTEEWEVEGGDRAGSSSPAMPRGEFPVVFRGYDRARVDEYLEDVNRLIEELEAPQSPDAAVKEALDRVGEQTSGILQRAREAEESITARSRARAEERLRDAERTARALREQAEAKVRELDEDNEVLWQERHRVLDDLQRLFNQLGRVVAAANRRFPPVDGDGRPAEAVGAAGLVKLADPDLDPAVGEPRPGQLDAQILEEPVEVDRSEHPERAENRNGALGDREHRAQAAAEKAESADGLFGEPPAWEDELRGPEVLEGVGERPWEPPAAETPITAYRVEDSEDEALDPERP
jgi:DivIVA domain-containing protein